MRILIRYFFKTVRAIIGPIILLVNWLTMPRGVRREPEIQSELDAQTRSLKLYQFRTCPFCIKVRREIKRLSLNIETRDAQHDADYRDELLSQGGELKVPCLQIIEPGGKVNWLYESDDIIRHLRHQFA